MPGSCRLDRVDAAGRSSGSEVSLAPRDRTPRGSRCVIREEISARIPPWPRPPGAAECRVASRPPAPRTSLPSVRRNEPSATPQWTAEPAAVTARTQLKEPCVAVDGSITAAEDQNPIPLPVDARRMRTHDSLAGAPRVDGLPAGGIRERQRPILNSAPEELLPSAIRRSCLSSSTTVLPYPGYGDPPDTIRVQDDAAPRSDSRSPAWSTPAEGADRAAHRKRRPSPARRGAHSPWRSASIAIRPRARGPTSRRTPDRARIPAACAVACRPPGEPGGIAAGIVPSTSCQRHCGAGDRSSSGIVARYRPSHAHDQDAIRRGIGIQEGHEGSPELGATGRADRAPLRLA